MGYHNKRKKVQVTNSGEDRESYRGEMQTWDLKQEFAKE